MSERKIIKNKFWVSIAPLCYMREDIWVCTIYERDKEVWKELKFEHSFVCPEEAQEWADKELISYVLN